ncbi:MAG: tetratricopeptide repeat protein, partial [bacterium]|nr:tetratricopeptide repeat protein [bacterium]
LKPFLFLQSLCYTKLNDEFFIFRKRHDYLHSKFFESDLMDEFSKVYYMYADFEVKNKIPAINYSKKSAIINPITPYSYSLLGFSYMLKNNYDLALVFYKASLKKYESYLKLAYRFKADIKTIDSIKRDFSAALTNTGYLYEKKGDINNARFSYLKAIELNPRNENAIYNLAVSYFNENRQLFRYYIEELLKINPEHEAKKYIN